MKDDDFEYLKGRFSALEHITLVGLAASLGSRRLRRIVDVLKKISRRGHGWFPGPP